MSQAEKLAIYLAKAPIASKGALERAFVGSASPRSAIKAKCLSCSNFQRDEITECKVYTCPLHFYRPFQPKKGRQNREPV